MRSILWNFIWGTVLIFAPLLDVQAKGDSWRTITTNSEVANKPIAILEAYYQKKDFMDTISFQVGCRFSHPEPSIRIKLPDLSTDIMNPQSKATVYFADKKKKIPKEAIEIGGVVNHGDLVLLPNVSGEQEENLKKLFELMKQNEEKGIYFKFIQNQRTFEYKLPLKKFGESFEAALLYCKSKEEEQ